MPASRPQHPDRQAKTTTAATATANPTSSLPSKEQPQPQLQYAIVSSPLSSPTNPHLERFSGPPSSLSFARLQPSPPKSNSSSHATDKDLKSKSPSENAVIAVVPSSSSVSSTSSSHSSSSNRNVASSRAHALPPPPPLSQPAKAQSESQTQMIALAEARVFAQQLHQQQLQQQQQQQQHFHQQSPNQFMGHLDASRRGSLAAARPQSVVGSLVSGRGSTAASAAVGGSLSPVLRGGGVGGDEPAEQTLLLVRPVWIQDQDAAACRICARAFNAVRRKHHCRQCGHIFCHDCSSRSIALPQLGYTKAVRVCNDCFEVAYLVAYCLSDDLGPSTQIHGARGLYELVETNDEKVLENVLEHGGLDAIVYLCSVVHGFELHALATKSLAALSDHQAIQGMIVSKRAMPKLFHLVSAYAYHVASPLRPPSPPMPLTRMASTASLHTTGVRRIETIAAILIHITHIVYQMVSDKILARQMAKEGAVDGLMCLCVYFPAGVRTRAMEHAIRSVSMARDEALKGRADTPLSDSQGDDGDHQSQRSTPLQASHGDDDDEDDAGVVSMDDVFHVRLENMQGQAARCLSVLAADVSNQAFIVDDPERIDRLVQLLYSNNPDVVKYASKTMAYLSLRNDRYKPDIVKGAGAAALLTVIRTGSENYANCSNGSALSEAVSHACCALANLATNTESQEILMSHLDLLHATCSVVGLFPHQREIERHVARLIANLALYDQNKLSLLTAYSTPSDHASLDPSQSPRDQHPVAVPHRYSSPPPPARRAKGNVIPTLLYIGAQTLERTGVPENFQEDPAYLQQGQDAIDFMNDDQASAYADAGYLTPNDSASEIEVGHGEHERSIHEEVLAEWTTVPGMEDVQRHIIRAIDNLITSVMDDPASNQSFKVFSRIWPTIGLIKTIQMTNQDEDTQRRATHVLSTLVHQQQIHAETITAFKELNPSSESSADAQHGGLGEEERLERQRLADEEQQRLKEEAEAAAKAAELEQALLEKERHVKEEVEKKQKERNERKAAKEKLEQEKKKAEREAQEAEERDRLRAKAEQERLKLEQQEQERADAERVKREKIEQERLEKEHLEQERLEKERLKQERSEKKRLEKERLEKERLEKERLEKERLEKERLQKERLQKERLEKERLEKERLEKERLEKERLEKERLEKERLEKERLEEECLEKERLEEERHENERLEKERLEEERLEEERLEKERPEEEHLEKELEKDFDDHPALEQAQAQEEREVASDSTKAGTKGGSSSEDQTTSHDEEPKPKEKAKKKKKKHAK